MMVKVSERSADSMVVRAGIREIPSIGALAGMRAMYSQYQWYSRHEGYV